MCTVTLGDSGCVQMDCLNPALWSVMVTPLLGHEAGWGVWAGWAAPACPSILEGTPQERFVPGYTWEM